ncbi:MAG TPA: hypothetical protein VM716_07695 [Gemmatimonadales bacterium]|nr:hypothetical protein [Gemmatimonadales bacterium]
MLASLRRPSWHVALAAALVVTGCSNNAVGPTKPADPVATAARVQAIHGSFNSNILKSFEFATPYAPTATSPLATLRPLLNVAQSTFGARRSSSLADARLAAAALRAGLLPSSGVILASIFPPGVVLGTTYTWDAATSQYVANDPAALPGAPANGVRFILYALDLSGIPIATQPIGYVDFMDESSGNAKTLHVVVVGTTTTPPVTYLDDTISVTAVTSSANATVIGFVTDGTERLAFDIGVAETASHAVIDIQFDVTPADAHVKFHVTLTLPSASTLQYDISDRIEAGGELITVTGTITVNLSPLTESGSLAVAINGGPYATITDSNGSLTYAGGGGQSLTADDHAALLAIFNAVAESLQHFNELVAPATSLGL